jgi:broad-specificity NMP kinase
LGQGSAKHGLAWRFNPQLHADIPRETALNSVPTIDRNRAARRVLITGSSGVGKSSVIQELSSRGHAAVDLDCPEWSHWVDADPTDQYTPSQGKDWVWREDRVRALLSGWVDGILFVSGCAENMGRLFPLLDLVILLSAPLQTIMGRLEYRSIGSYGHSVDERAKIAHLISTVEPLLRRAADYEIQTTRSVHETADEVLRLSLSNKLESRIG